MITWFITPMNTIAIYVLFIHRYWNYVHQLSYRSGASNCS